MQVSVHPGIGELDSQEWDRACQGNPIATHGWLSTVEATYRGSVEPRYFSLRQDGVLISAAVAYLCKQADNVESLDDILLGRLKRTASRLGISFLPALVCGPIGGYGWHIGVSPELDAAEGDGAREHILNAIEKEADQSGAPLSFGQVLDSEVALIDLLRRRGYLHCRDVPIGVLDISWGSFQEYLNQRPRRLRKSIRQQIRRNEAEGCVIESATRFDQIEPRLIELLDSNSRKHNQRPFPFGKGFFEALSNHMNDRAVVTIARVAGQMTGVCVVLRLDETEVTLAVGVDRDAVGEEFTYFRLGYYQPIADAIARQARWIYYGRGMYKIKLRRGCRLIDSWTFARKSGIRRLAVAPWFAALSLWNRHKLPGRVRNLLRQPDA